jgi:hypothetical protein
VSSSWASVAQGFSRCRANTKLEKDGDFKNYIGDLLVEIMSSNIEQEVVDETGTDDLKESNLQ